MAIINEYLFYYPSKDNVFVVNIYSFKSYKFAKKSYYKLIDRGCSINSRKGFSPINFYDGNLSDDSIIEKHNKIVVYIGNQNSNFYNKLKDYYGNSSCINYIKNTIFENDDILRLKNILTDFYDLINEGINNNKLYFSSNIIEKTVTKRIDNYIENDYNFLQKDGLLYCLITGIDYMNRGQNHRPALASFSTSAW